MAGFLTVVVVIILYFPLSSAVLFCSTYLILFRNCVLSVNFRHHACTYTDPTPQAVNIIGEPSTAMIVTLDKPTALQCYAVGWPRPIITWWRAEKMLPRQFGVYEQLDDNSLVIRLVTVDMLGPYTCQAYNGEGRAASWSVTLQAYNSPFGDHHRSNNPYLIAPPRHPATGDGVYFKPIFVKVTRPPPIYRIATIVLKHITDDATQTPPPPPSVFSGKPIGRRYPINEFIIQPCNNPKNKKVVLHGHAPYGCRGGVFVDKFSITLFV